MFKVKGTLTNRKQFKFDAKAGTLAEAVTELNAKLASIPPTDGKKPDVVSVSFATRGMPNTELALVDMPKRARKDTPATPAKAATAKR